MLYRGAAVELGLGASYLLSMHLGVLLRRRAGNPAARCQAELALIPGSGHFAPLARPAAFNRIVLAFLTGERVPTPTA